MKPIYSILFAICLLSFVVPAAAQRPGKLFSFGFGLEGGAPLNDAANTYNFSGGATFRFSLHAPHGFVTFTTGGIAFMVKDVENQNLKTTTQIPFKIGYKYIFMRHFFAMGELGYSALTSYYDNGDGSVSHVGAGGFTYAPSVGIQFRVMELALKYENVSVSNSNFGTGNLSTLGLRLGFNF